MDIMPLGYNAGGQPVGMLPRLGGEIGNANAFGGGWNAGIGADGRWRQGLAGLGRGGGQGNGGFVDPETGQLLRTPQTPQELAQAETEARNAAIKGRAAFAEASINKGTEEITESEREARRQATTGAAASGVTNAADMQGGLQALGSQYAGMRANLARDVRANEADKQRQSDSEFFGRMFQYAQASAPKEESGGGGGGGGGGFQMRKDGKSAGVERYAPGMKSAWMAGQTGDPRALGTQHPQTGAVTTATRGYAATPAGKQQFGRQATAAMEASRRVVGGLSGLGFA